MIRVLGVERTIAHLAAVAARMAAAEKPATAAVGGEVAEDARRRVAVETGETRESIVVTDQGVEASSAALYLEFGTYKMAAQPFMRPAADEARADAAAAIYRRALGGI